MHLYDTESGTPMQSFERKGDVQAIAWQSWAPGNFVSVGRRSGVAKLWNVSQRRSVGMVPIASSGFKSLMFVSSGARGGGGAPRIVTPLGLTRHRRNHLRSLTD